MTGMSDFRLWHRKDGEARICWRDPSADQSGASLPMSRLSAESLIQEAERAFPDLEHWIEPVGD